MNFINFPFSVIILIKNNVYAFIMSILLSQISFLFLIIFFVLISFLIYRRFCPKNNLSTINNTQISCNIPDFRLNLIFFIVGCFFLLLAIFPYALTGHLLSNGWNSRNQLLLPLGLSFCLYFGSKLIFLKVNTSLCKKMFILASILTFCVLLNFSTNLDLQKYWYKESSISTNIKDSEIIKSHTSFIFEDNAILVGSHSYWGGGYGYTSMMASNFKDQTRWGLAVSAYDPEAIWWRKDYIFNANDFILKKPEYLIKINYGDSSYSNEYKLMYLEIFNKPEFQKRIKDYVKFEYIPISTINNNISTYSPN